MNEYLVAIDWGTTKLAIIVARQIEGGMAIESVQSIPYSDMQGNDWSDTDFIVPLLSKTIPSLNDITESGVIRTVLGVPGYYTGILENSCTIEVDGGVITHYHISKVLGACGKYPLPDEWHISQVIPKSFIIDGQRHVDDPIDIKGSSLGVNSCLVCINQEFISQVVEGLAEQGIHVDYVKPMLLSSGNIFLTDEEKQNGSVLIDVGGKSTDIIIYKDGVPTYTDWLPVGGFSITNDLSIGLDISFEQAENLKRQCVLGLDLSDAEEKEQLYMPLKIGEENVDVPLNYIQEIVELRIEELFELIGDSIDRSNTIDRQSCSAVLIGGGVASIRGARDFANIHLDCREIRIGEPDIIGASNGVTLASTYALLKEQVMAIPPDIMEDEHISIKDRIIQWLSAFFNK